MAVRCARVHPTECSNASSVRMTAIVMETSMSVADSNVRKLSAPRTISVRATEVYAAIMPASRWSV